MDRRLHSFTLSLEASDYVRRMKRGSKSHQVSQAIEKYAADYKLSPSGVRYWQKIADDYRQDRNRLEAELNSIASKQGVKHHLAQLLRLLLIKVRLMR